MIEVYIFHIIIPRNVITYDYEINEHSLLILIVHYTLRVNIAKFPKEREEVPSKDEMIFRL